MKVYIASDKSIKPKGHVISQTDTRNDCFRRFIAALKVGMPVIIIHGVPLQDWEISPYVLAGESFGYEVEILDDEIVLPWKVTLC